MPPAAFLHGVEVIESNIGPVPIQVVSSAVIGLVGSAPLFAVAGAIPVWDPSWLVQATPGWPASTAEVVGNLIVDSNGNTQKCTTAGTTGTSTPVWARSLNATTPDGTVVWTLIAIGAAAGQTCIDSNGNIETATAITSVFWSSGHAFNQGDMIVDSNGNMERCTVGGTTGGTAPVWPTTIGSTVGDSGITWTLVTIGRASPTNTTPPVWPTVVGNTVNDGLPSGTTGSVTWTLTAKGPIANLQQAVLIAGSNPNSLAPGQIGTFGPNIQGYTIPYALNEVFAQGAGQVICVNVFDQTKHYTTVTAQSLTFPATGNQVINLGHMGISAIKVTNSGATTTYVEGLDFTVDRVNGIITTLAGGFITTAQTVLVTYRYADPSKLVASDLVGSVSTGVYTGMQNWKLAYGLMGFFPKLLIAPHFGTYTATGQTIGAADPTVVAGMATVAAAMRAMYFVDCTPNTTPATMLSNRGLSGNAFNTSDKRAVLCGPQELFNDSGINPTAITIDPISGKAIQNIANTTHAGPYSPWVAGTTAGVDLQFGYWYSPSNHQINGPNGPDVSLYSSYQDPSADSNILNSQGILTAFQASGTGLRVWGNTSAAFPTYTSPDTFIAVRRTMDVIEQSIMLSMMQFLDQPISNGLITSILATTNSFLRLLISRGALVAGTASYNPVENPPAQIAAGQLVFDIDCIPPIPAQRLTFNVIIDTTLLSQLTGAASTATQTGVTA